MSLRKVPYLPFPSRQLSSSYSSLSLCLSILTLPSPPLLLAGRCASASLPTHPPERSSTISCFSTFAHVILSAWDATSDASSTDLKERACLGFGVKETWVRILASQLIIWTSTLEKYLTFLGLGF